MINRKKYKINMGWEQGAEQPFSNSQIFKFTNSFITCC